MIPLLPLLVADLPKLVVPSLPAGTPPLSMAISGPKPLSDSDVEKVAKGWVAKPNAKLFAHLDGRTLEVDDRAAMDLDFVHSIHGRYIDFRHSEKTPMDVVHVRLKGMDPKKRYVVVLSAWSTLGNALRFTSSAASADLTLAVGAEHVAIAFEPKAKYGWFLLGLGAPKKSDLSAVLALSGIDIYSV